MRSATPFPPAWRAAPGRSHIPLRVLDFGVARRLGCAPMGSRSAIAGIPVYVLSLKDYGAHRQNLTERLGALKGLSAEWYTTKGNPKMLTRIGSFYMPNIPSSVLRAQAAVFAKFGQQ